MRPLLFLLLATVFYTYSQAQKKKPISVETEPRYDSFFSSLKWRNIGPFRGGRANAICGVRNNDNTYYTGYTGGGIWKTQDAGESWVNISDGFFKVGSVGDIAVADSDPNVVYVGTGEHAVRGVMTSYGDGIYKSTDAGKSWKKMGLEKTRHISDVVVHPSDPDILWVAAQGTVHGPGSDRGIFKSTDGGTTWKKVLYINDSTGISSLSLDKINPRILYAASWKHQRYPWTVSSGGKGSGIWRSMDGGETWKSINNGLPAQLGKIGVSVSPANPARVYAIVEAEKSRSGLYRSDDRGDNWTLLSNDQDISARSWYYMEVLADPLNENVVYVMNAPLLRSIDGGRTFSKLRIAHGDTHDLWINPGNNSNIALADDGGGSISFNKGGSWSTLNNQPTGQFYRVNADDQFPYKVYGGQQDNTSVIISSRTNGPGISERDWTYGPGCESAFLAFDPKNPVKVLGGCYQGYIEVADLHTFESKDIQAYPSLNLAIPPKQMKYRFNWNAPIIASRHEAGAFYHAANVLLKTTSLGKHWEVISPDLTRNDTLHQGPGGGPFTNEGAGGENYNTINYVIESPLEKGTIWTGSDCGLVHFTKNGGANWEQVTPADLPESLIHSIELSTHEKGKAFLCATRYKFNDYSSYTYRTNDHGKTWVRITAGLQEDDFIRVIREDPYRKGLLYAGAERGFYISFDDGDNWQQMQLNLPIVTVTDMIFRQQDLIVSTAGRGFWILDGVNAIHQGYPLVRKDSLQLLTPKPSVRFGGGGELNSPAIANKLGENAPEGVILDYCLPELPDTLPVTLEIRDMNDRVIRTYSSKKPLAFTSYPGGPPPPSVLPAGKGMHRFLWNFRTETILPDVSGVFVYGDYRGYRVPPGRYRAILSCNGESASTFVEVLQDPRSPATPSQWEEQQSFLKRVAERITAMHKRINAIRKVRQQVQTYNDLFAEEKDYQDILQQGKALIEQIDQWQSEVVETRIKNGQDVINWPSKLNVEFFLLKSLADAHDPAITDGLKARLQDLEAKWDRLEAHYKGQLNEMVKRYNDAFAEKRVPAVLSEF